MKWLYMKSSALFPLFDISAKMSESDKTVAVESQVTEIVRVAKQKNRSIPVFAHMYYKYSDDFNFIIQVT